MSNAAPPGARIDEVFAAVLARAPEAVAVSDGDREVGYAELWEEAGRVAAVLAEQGVAPGGAVGLRVQRGWRVVAGILGIWRHGSGFVPIDPRYPSVRQEYILRDAGLRRLVTEDAAGELVIEEVESGVPAAEVPADLAYVIHTSGSTGDPKGVPIRHTQVLALLAGCAESYDTGPSDVWSFFHSHSFDFSVWEIWGALLSGGRVVVVPQEAATDPAVFAAFLADRGVTMLSQVPSVFGHLVRALEAEPRALPALRHVVFGGEAVNPQVLLRWYELGVAPEARLFNMYGITEITVHATVKRLTPQELRSPSVGTPIGRALPHLRIALLEDGRPVPPGLPGEIHISGAAVADGYLGRPELTAQRFVHLPELDGGGPWYRSGDYAVERPDGEYEFLGRRDDQVKIRGFRIELGEIEAVLAEQQQVREGAVVVAGSVQGEPMLVACFVPAGGADPGEAAGMAAELGAGLAERLPKHLVPGRFVPVRELPLTFSGKLDRSALARRIAQENG
ncbi:amino acid adenylation domain-containing protein [Kitasatospora sp. NPDC005856]|uniref:amino acid adenylation domain-containing protein n=1 Tax=Kitasatospora sp. NPDC005856 TaxID=3154566 RepID=UPI0033E92669